MRDRWVTVFVVFCLAQIPLYFVLGRDSLTYDAAMKSAETILNRPSRSQRDFDGVRASLDKSEQALANIGGQDSRRARLDLNRAMLAWNEGKTSLADSHFARAVRGFEATHGADSFHASAIGLRYAEFLMLSYRYPEALARFEKGVKPIEDTLGPKNSFAVRMAFRHVGLLVALGRQEEAIRLAREFLPALLENAGRLDEIYLTQVASDLEILSRFRPADGLPLPPAPGGHGWRPALKQAYQDGKRRLDENPDDSAG